MLTRRPPVFPSLMDHRRRDRISARAKHGRRTKRAMPEPIDADPEDIMRAVVSTPPKKCEEWRYLQDGD